MKRSPAASLYWVLWCAGTMLVPLAAQKAPDAPAVDGPALLRTWAPPVYPPDALKERLSGGVTVRLVVDERGAVASARVLDATDPRLGEAALSAARKWVFTPALDAGKPVACSMDAPILFSPADADRRRKPGFVPPPDQTPQPSPREPARAKTTPNVDYPDVLFDRKLAGRVLYSCAVAVDGHAVNPRVTAASHPDFVLPALRSLDHIEFSPGMQGDLPVPSEVEGEITFDVAGGAARDVLAANLITAPDGSAPAADLEPRVVADPVWPYDLLLKGAGGSATVLYTVNEKGVPDDVRVVAASDPDFGEALSAAVEMYLYSAPSVGGHSASVPLMQRAEFHAIVPGADAESDPVARLVAAIRDNRIAGVQGLDERLTPLYRVAPEYPAALRQKGRPAGRAEIEFIIDRDGRARLPRIVSATDPKFGWAAATAISQWVFRAPRKAGQPVDVRVRVPFEFKSPKA